MKVQVDMTKCQAYGLCAEEAPEVFDLDEWGYAVLAHDTVAADQEKSVLRAVGACPAQAIKTTD